MAGTIKMLEMNASSKEVEKKAIGFINKQLGNEAKNLGRIEDIVTKLKENKKELEGKLEYLVSSSSPDKINEALKAADHKLKEAENLNKTAADLKTEVVSHQKKVSGLLGSVEQQFNIITQHDRVKVYLNWVSSIQQISSEMSTLSCISNESNLLECFNQLEEYHHLIADKSACINLQEYIAQTLSFWHTKLLQDFSKEYESVLSSLHFPFVISTDSASQTTPPPELYNRLEVLAKHLLSLSNPNYNLNIDCKTSNESDPFESNGRNEALLSDFTPLITPLKLLLKPLEVRFLYHFSGDKKTNSASHPEWCLTRVLSWINDHHNFLVKFIQPILKECQYGHINAKAEISRGLVKLTMLKLSEDLPVLLEDEDLFCHCLQETLNFERELQQNCDYPSSQPSVLGVLTQPHVLNYWISLERKFAVALMDEFVSMPGTWDSHILDEDEGGGVSACGEHLVTLLQGITDRYKNLPQPGHRLQFLEVQLDVLDEFRVRAAQLARECVQSPVTSHYPAILNTLRHVSDTLCDWGDVPMFLELQMHQRRHKKLEEAAESMMNIHDEESGELTVEGSVFESCLSLYTHMEEEMQTTLHYHVLSVIKNRGVTYRRDKWFIEAAVVGRRDTLRVDDVSPSLCPLLEVLVSQLSALHKTLTVPLFTCLWQAVAKDIDKYLYVEVVLQNHFSEVGASQLDYDMKKALFPIFAEYSTKPQGHFVFIKECSCLLSLHRATAMLLRDTLHLSLHGSSKRDVAASSVINPVEALAEHGVARLTVEQAYTVLNRRTNMATF